MVCIYVYLCKVQSVEIVRRCVFMVTNCTNYTFTLCAVPRSAQQGEPPYCQTNIWAAKNHQIINNANLHHHHHHHHQPHHFFQDQKGLSIRGRQAGWCSTRWSLLPRRDNSIVGKVPFEFYSYASSCEFFVLFFNHIVCIFVKSETGILFGKYALCLNFWNFDFVVNIVDNLG